MDKKKVFEGKYMSVFEEKIGNSMWERAYLMPSVQVIPFTKDGKVVLIKERREAEGCTRWHFVAGLLDKEGLSPEQVAQEELMEEAGLSAGRLEKYFHHEYKHSFIIPITYFLAYDLKENRKPNPDGDVIEEIKAFSIEELHQRVLEGEFDFLHEASMIMKLYRDWKSGKLKTD